MGAEVGLGVGSIAAMGLETGSVCAWPGGYVPLLATRAFPDLDKESFTLGEGRTAHPVSSGCLGTRESISLPVDGLGR